LVIGILIILISVNIGGVFAVDIDVKTVSSAVFDGNTLYVGGSGANNYTTIQSAIDDALEGDTVFVYDDSSPYYENVVIDKSIILQGENNSNTIIDGNKNGNVIHIIADDVTISDFTLQHYGTIWYDSGIKIESNDNTITDNNIYGNYDGACNSSTGIYVINSNHNFVENNHILNNSYGIFNTDSKLSIFSANQIINNYDGIRILNSNNNEIKNNEFINNNCAIVIHSSNGNSIYTNNIKLGGWVGIDLNRANTNTIKRNNIIENNRYGLRIRWSKYNVVTENNLIQNYEQAFLLSSQRTAINNNYWDDWNYLFLPRPINCTINIIFMLNIPWFKFDWNPAQEPYDIEV
jgi:parallel beta-helix repeat protein